MEAVRTVQRLSALQAAERPDAAPQLQRPVVQHRPPVVQHLLPAVLRLPPVAVSVISGLRQVHLINGGVPDSLVVRAVPDTISARPLALAVPVRASVPSTNKSNENNISNNSGRTKCLCLLKNGLLNCTTILRWVNWPLK